MTISKIIICWSIASIAIPISVITFLILPSGFYPFYNDPITDFETIVVKTRNYFKGNITIGHLLTYIIFMPLFLFYILYLLLRKVLPVIIRLLDNVLNKILSIFVKVVNIEVIKR